MADRTSSAERGPPIADVVTIRGTFPSADMVQDAIERLMVSGFDRADLSLPNSPSPSGSAAPDSGARPADTEQDARQARTLHTSGVAAAAALAAAGITIGTGGAMAPAVAAAVAAGAAAGGATYAASTAANDAEQQHRDVDAAQGVLTLSVRVPSPAKLARADAIMRAAGATRMAAVRDAST
jgi:hypothetical protein